MTVVIVEELAMAVGPAVVAGEIFDGCWDRLNEFRWRVIKSNTGRKRQAESESIVYYY